MATTPLPIDDHLESLRAALTAHRAAVLVAAPGAGKTTRVPPAVSDGGCVIVLQPRRVAARAVARRIAEEQGWTPGREVGWHIRFDRRVSSETRVLIVTEGMLTAYLDEDPLLSRAAVVVLDEFHERSLHTDVGLALLKQAWLARSDLRVVVMSATLDPGPVAAFLGDCPVIDVPGATHALRVEYAPGQGVAEALGTLLPTTRGAVLCFLSGAGDIERAMQECHDLARRYDVDLLPLHGSLDADAQDLALRPSARRRVVMATNIAETSLTVPGVSVVIDTGYQKVARYDAERAIDALVIERVTRDSADQRAGRAARLGPGLVRRLWDERDRLKPAREPEVHRVDLAGTVLSILAAGNRMDQFEWFEPPAPGRTAAALSLLRRLGAVQDLTVTSLGHRLRRLPLHPRVGRVLLEGGGSPEAAAACALLTERGRPPTRTGATACDLLPMLDAWAHISPHTRRVADHLQRLAAEALGADRVPHTSERALRRALLAGYPDRVARRRTQDPARAVLASGRGARMGRESQVEGGEWLVALDVTDTAGTEAVIRMASVVEPEWIEPTSRAVEHRFDEGRGAVRAVEIARYDAIVMSERPVAPDPDVQARVLAHAWLHRGPDEATTRLLARARFAGLGLDPGALALTAAAAARSLDDIDIAAALPWETRGALDERAPERLTVPSGRTVRLEYAGEGRVTAAVKLQELFGLADTPRIGRQREPVTFELLAPNGRPVQTTRDLRSFWERTYPEVRKELRGRYPKHPWPEDPWTATPTHRTTRRS